MNHIEFKDEAELLTYNVKLLIYFDVIMLLITFSRNSNSQHRVTLIIYYNDCSII